MSRFVIRAGVRPHFYYGSLQAATPAIADALGELISDLVTIESRPSSEGGEALQVALLRPTHTEAFEDVARAVAQAGYSLIEAEVAEVVDEAATAAFVGLIGGGTPGALADNPLVAAVGAAIGWWAGREIGVSMRKVGAVHRYWFSEANGWLFANITRQREVAVTVGSQPRLDSGGAQSLAF